VRRSKTGSNDSLAGKRDALKPVPDVVRDALMDSSHVSCQQAEKMHAAVYPLANYLCRIVRRMERTGFPPSDDIYRKAATAYGEVRSLLTALHDLSCKHGVGRKPRE
jgi:hypothetical protein